MTDPLQDAAAMAELARKTLLEAVLPHIPQEQRYQALMVANAIGIAARALEGGNAAQAAEAADYRRLLGADGEDVAALRRRLAEAIRSGALDDDPALVALLRRRVAAALAIANPAYATKPER